jgi:hypothetical protein
MQVPQSRLFQRGTWKFACGYYGHDKTTTITRFCPVLFKATAGENSEKTTRKSKKFTYFSLVAVGSMDKTVSVWMTSKESVRALV